MKTRRGISLLETVVCVLILGVAVPPTLELLQAAGAERADSVNTTRAVLLATLVAETVVADAASTHPDLGPGALTDATAYLETPSTGLNDRLAVLTEPFTRLGMTWEVEIGPPISASGEPDADASQNIFRAVEVRVRYPSASGEARTMPVGMVVGGQAP